MPVSDYLLALALSLHPQAQPGLSVTLNADAIGQPDGAVLVRTSTTPPPKIKYEATGAPIKGAAPASCQTGEHYIKYWRAEGAGKVHASKCANIKYFPKTDYLATGKVFPK